MSESTPSALQIAFDATVVRRALIMAAIVGTILVLINHFNCCVAHGMIGNVCMVKMIMTFLVPYTVSTVSSVQAIKCKAYKVSKTSSSG